jgi:hypothetical protein
MAGEDAGELVWARTALDAVHNSDAATQRTMRQEIQAFRD